MNTGLHCLITNVEGMAGRWKSAFPKGRCIGIDGVKNDASTIVWLDLSARTSTEKQQLLQQLARYDNKLIALSSSPDKQEAMSAVRLGCSGYGHLMAAPEQFSQMAAVVINGGYWLGQDLMSDVIEDVVEQSLSRNVMDDGRSQLTSREIAVADEVARGASNKEIAEKLSISERTVKAHLSAIFEKLQLRDRVQLALKLNCVSF